MKQKKMDIAELLEKFLKGETCEAEEQMLTDYFYHADQIPEDWHIYKELFQSFRTDAYDFSPEEMDEMLAAAPEETGTKFEAATEFSLRTSHRCYWRITGWIAAAACLSALVFTAALRPWKSSEQESSSQVAQEITLDELLETLNILAEAIPEDATITATPAKDGIEVITSTPQGTSATYALKRRADSSTLELTSQLIHN